VGHAGHEATLHRGAHERKDDWDRRRGRSGSGGGEIPVHHQHLDLALDQLRGECGEPLGDVVRMPLLDDDIGALHIAESAQSLPEGVQILRLGRRPP